MSDSAKQSEGSGPTPPEEIDFDGQFVACYRELREYARGLLRGERPEHLLEGTALVHEVWLRLVRAGLHFADRTHFLRTFRRAMRRLLIDVAKRRQVLTIDEAALRRSIERLGLAVIEDFGSLDHYEAVDAAFASLRERHPEHAEAAELKYFCELTNDRIAEELGLGEPAVRSRLSFARAWLARELRRRGIDLDA